MWEGGNYDTSYTNYLNVAMMDLCFQMFAEVKDVDELLEMVRSTSLTDYINLDWETQPLQLINPAGFLLEYLMPTDLPASIKMGETVTIKKGYYKGVVFNIPGAEVKIGDQWIAYDDKNKRQIHAQNPMTLEWRLNAKDYLRKLGYKKGNTLTGQIIVVDDQWHGLNIFQDVNVIIE